MKESVEEFNEEFNNLNGRIEKIIKLMADDIRYNKTDHLHLINPTLVAIIKLSREGVNIHTELSQLLKAKFNDIYYKIKVGNHRLSQLGTLSYSEVNKLIPGELEYLDIEEMLELVDSKLESLRALSKVLSEYSFHYKNKLDWEKFNQGN